MEETLKIIKLSFFSSHEVIFRRTCKTASIWLIEAPVSLSSWWLWTVDLGCPPPSEPACMSFRDSSFWEHRIIHRPLQERVWILSRGQETQVSFRVEPDPDLLGWRKYASWPVPIHLTACGWYTLGRDYSAIAVRREFAAKLTLPQTIIWKAESETGVFILCQVHRLAISVPPANRHLTFWK